MEVRVEHLELLPLERRLELVEALWASIGAELDRQPLSEELATELRRRRDEYLRDPTAAVDWQNLRRRLENRE